MKTTRQKIKEEIEILKGYSAEWFKEGLKTNEDIYSLAHFMGQFMDYNVDGVKIVWAKDN